MDNKKGAPAQNGLDPDLAELLNIKQEKPAPEPGPGADRSGEPDFHTLFTEEKVR